MAAASQPVCVEPIDPKKKRSKTKLYVYVGTHVNSGCQGGGEGTQRAHSWPHRTPGTYK